MAPLAASYLTPWESPEPTSHADICTTWQAAKRIERADLQSTSTVTTTASRSSSSTSSPHPSNTPSPLSTSEQPPTTWQFEPCESRPGTPVHQSGSIRTLPRCGVVNFRKDGESLRWAPRVTHNSSGVAARVHNFEDAFSLEEFSSRALPVVWRSKGGNPRLSDVSKSDGGRRDHATAVRSVSHQLPPPRPHPKRAANNMEKRAKSAGHAQRAFVRNSSVKKAVVLAAEVSRPSFWSLIAHTSKYQRSRAKARLQGESKKRTDNPQKRSAPLKSNTVAEEDKVVPRKLWGSLSDHKRTSRHGKATRRAPQTSDKKSTTLFQRLLSYLDRRNSRRTAPAFEDTTRQTSVQANGMAWGKSDGSSDSDSRQSTEKPKSMFRQIRHSEGPSSRRSVSSMGDNPTPRKVSQRRGLARVTSQVDQYVTFITSED